MYQLFPAAVAQVVYLTKFNDKFSHLTEQKVVESEREEDPEINQKNLSRGPIWFRIRKEFVRMRNKLIWKLYGKNKLISLGGYYGLVPINRNFETRLSKDE
jgi:spore coat polysaccharide biosynthesis predicted glycosyltransferase SpsG